MFIIPVLMFMLTALIFAAASKEEKGTELLGDPKDVIYEEIWIESPTDTDGDGKRDLIYAQIARPAVTEKGVKAAALVELSPYYYSDWEPLKKELRNVDREAFPGAGEPGSPERAYADVKWNGVSRSGGHTYKELLAAGFKPDWLPPERRTASVGRANRIEDWLKPDAWRRYFISRGYAAVNVHMLGGKMSEGLLSDGGYEECLAAAAVVDWLNGRVKAYTSITEGEGWVEVKADWSNGKAAMNGTSYCGTLPLGAACTGVEGLMTILPEAPVFSYYEYYRSNGMPYAPGGWQGEDSSCLLVICNTRYLEGAPVPVPEAWTKKAAELRAAVYEEVGREDGSYSAFWDERNLAALSGNIRCSILQTHGYGDWNVKFRQAAMIWTMCEKYGLEHRAIFHRGAHQSALGYDGLDIYSVLHAWLDHYLYGVDNGMPGCLSPVTSLDSRTAEWKKYPCWPFGHNAYTKFGFENGALTEKSPAGGEITFTDTFIPGVKAEERGGFNTEKTYGDGPLTGAWEDLLAGKREDGTLDLTAPVPDRALFVSAPLEKDTMLSGTGKITLRLKAGKGSGAVSAMVVDYGDVREFTVEKGTTKVDLGDGNEAALDTPVLTEEVRPYKIVTRGSVNLRNPNPSGKIWTDAADTAFVPTYCYQTENIQPGTWHSYTWDLVPTDYTFAAGHRLGVILYGSDPAFTVRPFTPNPMTVDTGASCIELPLV